jgi:hypothetical protein
MSSLQERHPKISHAHGEIHRFLHPLAGFFTVIIIIRQELGLDIHISA